MYNGHYYRDSTSLVQAWNYCVCNVDTIGRGAWIDKLIAAPAKFEKKNHQRCTKQTTPVVKRDIIALSLVGGACQRYIDKFGRVLGEVYLFNLPSRGVVSPLRCTKELRLEITLQTLVAFNLGSVFPIQQVFCVACWKRPRNLVISRERGSQLS